MNNFFLKSKTAPEINSILASRLKAIRKKKGYTQLELSTKSGVSLGSLKRFEQKGEISLLSFTKLVMGLGCEDELLALFNDLPLNSIEEVIDGQN